MKQASSFPRTVFMVVAHNNPALLARLVGRLRADWARVVVLIDAKADQGPFETALRGGDVTFLPADQRVDVQWGGIGLTLSALRMMRTAIASFSADRLCMLSGVDYPIKPIDDIGRALGGTTEFVRVDRVLDPAGSGLHDDFIRSPHFNDVRLLNPRSSPAPLVQRAALRALRLVPRRRLAGLTLHHGGGWWCITRAAADWVLDYVHRQPDVIAWLRHANCPDEIFMQTLLKASPFAGAIAQDMTISSAATAEPNVHGCHYVDWSAARSSSPKLMEIGDLPALRASSALFTRKLDPARSATLMDALDASVAA